MKQKGHRIYKIILCVILLAVSFFCVACTPEVDTTATATPNKNAQTAQSNVATATPVATVAPVETEAPVPTQDLSMYAVNPITGLQDLDKTKAGNRPMAIMISNIKAATPQFGITDCDMYYEIEAEGGITRIMGIFADVSRVPAMLGPVRSARDYYVDLALGYNAVFAHYGTSTSASNKIKNYGVDNLDGMYLSSTFWRDAGRLASKGLEHSAVTSGEKLASAIASKKYATGGSIGNFFSFYNADAFTVDGTLAGNRISAKFSSYNTAVFNYNAQDKLYYKNQFDAPHVDAAGKQIAVTNVIVLHTNIKVVSDEGHLSVDLSGGKGYYFSGGVGKEITWSKGGATNPIRYYNIDGTELTVNAGKTYVCIVRSADRMTMA